jgi:hypothetical protein
MKERQAMMMSCAAGVSQTPTRHNANTAEAGLLAARLWKTRRARRSGRSPTAVGWVLLGGRLDVLLKCSGSEDVIVGAFIMF